MEYVILFAVTAAVGYGLWSFLTGGRKTPRYEYKVDSSGNEYVHDHNDFSIRDLTADQGLTFGNKPNYPLRPLGKDEGIRPGPIELKTAGRAYMTPAGIKRTDDPVTDTIVPAVAVMLAMDAMIGGSDDSRSAVSNDTYSGGGDSFGGSGGGD